VPRAAVVFSGSVSCTSKTDRHIYNWILLNTITLTL